MQLFSIRENQPANELDSGQSVITRRTYYHAKLEQNLGI